MNPWAIAAICVSVWAGTSVYAARWLYRNRERNAVDIWTDSTKGGSLFGGMTWPVWILAWGAVIVYRLLLRALMGDLPDD